MILLPIGISSNNSNTNANADFDNKVDRKQVNISSLKCNNINVDVNGLELNVSPSFLGDSGLAAEAVEGNTEANSIAGNGASEINNFRFICINNNNNTVIEESTPPSPASLTVKKQVFDCDNITSGIRVMDCWDLQNNYIEWLNCNNSNNSNSEHCQSLPENIFDIEVLDDKIQNLKPGIYTVNEIKIATFAFDQLVENPDAELACLNAGFIMEEF